MLKDLHSCEPNSWWPTCQRSSVYISSEEINKMMITGDTCYEISTCGILNLRDEKDSDAERAREIIPGRAKETERP